MAWKSRCGEWSRPPEPSPDASGMLVQLLRAATECEFDLVPEPGQVMQRARTSDAKSSNSPPAQGALHDPIQGNEFRLTDLVGTLPVALRKQVPGRNRSGFDAESCNHCGFPPSDHIQKRPTCPPPAKSVNLNSLPWTPSR